MQTREPVRAAVVGGGAFGECHLKTLASMPDVELLGLYTLEQDRGEALCERYGGRCFSSLDELATDPSIELVTIATPEDAHFESFRVLAEHGKAIYDEFGKWQAARREKNLVRSAQEASGMLGMVLLLATGPATGESRPASLDAEAASEPPLSVDDILRNETPAADHPASGKSERVTGEP